MVHWFVLASSCQAVKVHIIKMALCTQPRNTLLHLIWQQISNIWKLNIYRSVLKYSEKYKHKKKSCSRVVYSNIWKKSVLDCQKKCSVPSYNTKKTGKTEDWSNIDINSDELSHQLAQDISSDIQTTCFSLIWQYSITVLCDGWKGRDVRSSENTLYCWELFKTINDTQRAFHPKCLKNSIATLRGYLQLAMKWHVLISMPLGCHQHQHSRNMKI